ncbi:MAG: YciI family protein [Acidobacteriota bacterium]
MSKFLLLLHESPADYSNVSAEEIQFVIGEYTAWRNKLVTEGRFAGGEKLKDEGGRHLSTVNNQVRVVDGPYAEAKEIMGGYFIIEAADYDEAVSISRECPHLKFGGRIELREIDALMN